MPSSPSKSSRELVLGLDPGTRRFGWGLVEREASRVRHRDHGIIVLDEGAPISERLVQLARELRAVVLREKPTCAAAESIFFSKDPQATAKLGHARGVALLICGEASLPVFEYPPATVKRSVAGSGRAEKSQVAQMVRAFLGLIDAPASDAADALAVALTHIQRAPFLEQEALLRGRSPSPKRAPRTKASFSGTLRLR